VFKSIVAKKSHFASKIFSQSKHLNDEFLMNSVIREQNDNLTSLCKPGRPLIFPLQAEKSQTN